MRKQFLLPVGTLACLVALTMASARGYAQDKSLDKVLKDQAQRVAVVKKIMPTVVAVFSRGGKGGGSGVLISPEGYALTNYHVVASSGSVMKCGLNDGHLYDAVLVGWDKVGDVALIKLLPKNPGGKLPFAPMGDSDTVKEGDWSLAAGNPFLLATDFTPTVTFGMISGVRRYQYPAGTFLEYTDCIQIDTSINPGNSGGPLYNMKGEVIGINGRGSFDKRGRVNSGVGYAISINQIKNFMGHLKAGLDADHASLGAIVTSQTEKGGLANLVVTQILEDCDAYHRGLDFDDLLASFDGRLLTSVNQYLNIIGTYPRGWRVPMEYTRDGKTSEILVRLMGKTRRVLKEDNNPKKPGRPKIKPRPAPRSPASKYYVAKEGYVNYYFNKQMKDQLLANFRKQGDFSKATGKWAFSGKIQLKRLRTASDFHLWIQNINDKNKKPIIEMDLADFPYKLVLLQKNPKGELRLPAGSGGLMVAMYLYNELLTGGFARFSEVKHVGHAPIYPPLPTGKKVMSWKSRRVMTEMVKSEFSRFHINWYFSLDEKNRGQLLAFEMRIDDEKDDPCEVYLGDYRPVQGKLLPHRIQVRYGDTYFGTIRLTKLTVPGK